MLITLLVPLCSKSRWITHILTIALSQSFPFLSLMIWECNQAMKLLRKYEIINSITSKFKDINIRTDRVRLLPCGSRMSITMWQRGSSNLEITLLLVINVIHGCRSRFTTIRLTCLPRTWRPWLYIYICGGEYQVCVFI